jgi:hypothetical protein
MLKGIKVALGLETQMSKMGSLLQRAWCAILAVAVVAAASSASAAEPVPAQSKPFTEGKTLPEGYRIERTWQSYWIVPSATVLGISYVLALSGAMASEGRDPYASLAIPFAGPFVALAKRDTNCDRMALASEFWCTFSFVEGDANMTAALLVDGIAQIASGTLVVLAMSAPRYQFERRELGSLRVVPIHVGSARGLGVQGSF